MYSTLTFRRGSNYFCLLKWGVMSLFITLLWFLTFSTCGMLPVYGTVGLMSDLEKIQGSWVAISAERDGLETTEKTLVNHRLNISGGQLSMVSGKRVLRYNFKLDPGRKPKWITLEDPRETPSILGIYEIESSLMKISLDLAGVSRPKKFETRPGSSQVTYKYHHVAKTVE